MSQSQDDGLESSTIEDSTGLETAFLPTATVIIIGLGLMGGSLALALQGHCAHLLGVDRDPVVVAQALERQVVEAASTELSKLLPQADLIIIAAPILASIKLLHQLPDLHPGSAMVIDLGSTKRMVLQAMATLPGRFDSLGGHPMCGKETGTLANAEAGLYQGAPFALVPHPGTTPRLRQVALKLVAVVGAHPLWLDADQHDQWVAHTSHLPHLLATALSLSTPLECAPLAGPGFRSTSRLASGSSEMKLDIFATNRAAVLQALASYRQQLDALDAALRFGDLETLRGLLTLGAERRQAFLSEGG